ncbi:protein-ADP-ribose hydrolase [Salinicoccus halodurans]|uniref:Protein-ADP-ribose hydrolase n=1 Tax=Salinicoccus halodurans TaxID=407035 RepID=A0AA94HHK5_9STAP|nr:protein-ADP-ribose hydrolase [Salinicoccus halodurans]SFK90454.1 O-acetyl-ADP-ribose deacetylase (regulator of RNase III), contains Macro domain [Salinicoccus halodurans]
MEQLSLDKYASNIKLREPFIPKQSEISDKEILVDDILFILRNEKAGTQDIDIPEDYKSKRRLIRALLNIRQPLPLDKEMMIKLDTLLQIELDEKTIIEAEQLETIRSHYPDTSLSQADKMSLWQGDITELRADAITNAANAQLLGCMQPLHNCVDNAIHSAAGPQLRDDCAEIIHVQKADEQTGDAKITRSYNLPSGYVLHTVGPTVPKGDGLTERHMQELASSYSSCLEIASQFDDIKTLVFPSISTGEFGFPITQAAEIAVGTVNEWLENNTHDFEKIIFNVFNEADKDVYMKIFRQ